MYMEFYHYMMILGGGLWGTWIGWMLRDDKNKNRIEGIQFAHIQELFRARKARLCDLMDLPHEVTRSELHQMNPSTSE